MTAAGRPRVQSSLRRRRRSASRCQPTQARWPQKSRQRDEVPRLGYTRPDPSPYQCQDGNARAESDSRADSGQQWCPASTRLPPRRGQRRPRTPLEQAHSATGSDRKALLLEALVLRSLSQHRACLRHLPPLFLPPLQSHAHRHWPSPRHTVLTASPNSTAS